jgi:uncharacterized membrane protein YhhN
MLSCLLVLAFIVASAFHLFYINKRMETRADRTKLFLMPLLSLFYISAIPANSFSYLVLFALLFSWAGDFLLNRRTNILYGMISFTITHLLYIIAFFIVISFSFTFEKLLLLLPAIIIIGITFPKYKDRLASLKIPVYVYMTIILSMHFIAVFGVNHNIGSLFFYIGSLCFIFSDSLIARIDLGGKNIIDGRLYVMSSYIFAQLFIVLGFLTI